MNNSGGIYSIMTKQKVTLALLAVLVLGISAGCKKKIPPPPPAAPAPIPDNTPTGNKPTISYFSAEPTTVTVGQPSSLRWSVTDATSVKIDNAIGEVSPNGRRGVYPTATTTYHLTATGPGGTSEADATVTVSSPPPPAPMQNAPQPTIQEILAKQVQDIHFDYDKSEVRGEDQAILQGDASALKTIFQMDANFVVTIEGHCDERGSAEYNLALGDRRAAATKDALISLGVPGDKLRTVSFGKERPLCTEALEDCYARNRRAHFSAAQ
jgi:peptidoglycan-associated lipoprotein